MSAIGNGGANYISDAQIMTWLATQQGRIYDDLRDSMDLSQERANFTEALNDIKAHLQEANELKDFSKVNQELKSFLEQYGSMPEFASICRDLEGMAETIDGPHAKYERECGEHVQDLQRHEAQAQAYKNGTSIFPPGPAPTPPSPPGSQQYSDEMLKSWTDAIGSKVDSLGKNDQLAMIHIQELKATLDQGAQLGSTFISSGDKTASAIINNIA